MVPTRSINRYLVLFVLTALGVALSVLFFLNTERRLRVQGVAAFERKAAEHISILKNTIERTRHELDALNSFYMASETVTRTEFAIFVEHLLFHNPAIQALEWVPRVHGSMRSDFENEAREEGLPSFEITELDGEGLLVTAAEREEYFPVYFVEPFEGNEKALGFDLGSSRPRARALEEALETGVQTATSRITLVQETGSQYGFLIFHPVYRRYAYQEGSYPGANGFFLGVYRIGDLLHPALTSVGTGEVDVHILDDTAPAGERFLLHYSGRDGSLSSSPAIEESRLNTMLHYAGTLNVAGRIWKVICTPAGGLPSAEGSFDRWGNLALGLLFTFLLSGYFFFILLRMDMARKHAAEIAMAKDDLEREVEERKLVEEQLRQREKLESLGVLAGGIAHDFNNLLTGIMGNISLAKMLKDSPAQLEVRLEQAENASVRAQGLTQQLLTFSKGGEPVKKTMPIAWLVKEACMFALHGSNVKGEFHFAEDLWPASIDEGQITQVVNNLVINAVQSMQEGGVIEVGCENAVLHPDNALSLMAGKYVKITVKDHGEGISKENLHRIFDPYFTMKVMGSGLGLAMVYSIIKKHDGGIAVESELGKGTLFSVYLPATSILMDFRAPREDLSVEALSGEGRILLMDDESLVRDVAANTLRHLGYDVVSVKDGEEAIDKYRSAFESNNPFDAVIMDLTVPGGMGGREAVKKLLEIDPELKAIVSSGYSRDPILGNYQDYGFRGVIAKPYKSAALGKVLREVLDSNGQGR